MRVLVSAPSRLHFSLLDLTGDLGFLDGGIGVALKLPRTVVETEESEELEVIGPRSSELLEKLKIIGLTGKIRVKKAPPSHMGFGSTTQLLLSALYSLCLINGIKCNYKELALLAGRGGTSGIGVRIFEEGGFVFDFGHSVKVKGTPKPSGASLSAPPQSIRLPFPEDWWFVIAYPKRKRGIYDERTEVSEFEKKTPIPPEESAKAVRIAYMLVIAGVVSKDFERFSKGINMLQDVGFKKIEVEIQPDEVKDVMRKMREVFGNAGLSSMGQAVYSVVPYEWVRKKLNELSIEDFEIIVTPPDNNGREVIVRG